MIAFKNGRFYKTRCFINDRIFPKTTVLIKFVISVAINNDNPLLMIINDDPC